MLEVCNDKETEKGEEISNQIYSLIMMTTFSSCETKTFSCFTVK